MPDGTTGASWPVLLNCTDPLYCMVYRIFEPGMDIRGGERRFAAPHRGPRPCNCHSDVVVATRKAGVGRYQSDDERARAKKTLRQSHGPGDLILGESDGLEAMTTAGPFDVV